MRFFILLAITLLFVTVWITVERTSSVSPYPAIRLGESRNKVLTDLGTPFSDKPDPVLSVSFWKLAEGRACAIEFADDRVVGYQLIDTDGNMSKQVWDLDWERKVGALVK